MVRRFEAARIVVKRGKQPLPDSLPKRHFG
jgi:hypothetical protein